jgi:hypothetical protein
MQAQSPVALHAAEAVAERGDGTEVIVTDSPQAMGSRGTAWLSLGLRDHRIADARSRAIEKRVQWGPGIPFSMGVEMMGGPAYKNINLSRG